jgi:hypothetical protein
MAVVYTSETSVFKCGTAVLGAMAQKITIRTCHRVLKMSLWHCHVTGCLEASYFICTAPCFTCTAPGFTCTAPCFTCIVSSVNSKAIFLFKAFFHSHHMNGSCHIIVQKHWVALGFWNRKFQQESKPHFPNTRIYNPTYLLVLLYIVIPPVTYCCSTDTSLHYRHFTAVQTLPCSTDTSLQYTWCVTSVFPRLYVCKCRSAICLL